MGEKQKQRRRNAVETTIGRNRVSEMTGSEYLQAVARVTAELKESQATQGKRK